MATTEITELQAATAFADGDLALIRKSGETKDRKISQSNLIKSIGNPAVKGFTATSNEANKVTLDPSNGTVIDTYYDGMEISFISPINSTGLVQVRIGALAYKDIFILNSAASVELTNTKYIQAIYSTTDNKFYQTNAATTQVFTNEYLATGVVANDNSTTTYTLTSAYGISKTQYYTGMSIIFTSDVASKGGVLVNIDGLGNKVLTDKADDKIANDLLVDQVILAIYDGTNFIKNLFSETVPEAPELPADAFDEQTGEIIPDNVPEVNKLNVTVGNAGNDYTSINAAIAGLVNNFGDDGGNRLCTINLSNTYVWNEIVTLNQKNYSWITIRANTEINIAVGCYLQLYQSSITVSGYFSDSNVNDKYLNTNLAKCFANISNKSNVIFSNFNLSTVNGLVGGNDGSYELNNCTITNKTTTDNILLIGLINQSPSSIKNTTINLYARDNNNVFNNYFIENSGPLTITNLTVNSYSTNGNYFKVSIFIYNSGPLTIYNSNINVSSMVLDSRYVNTYIENSTLRNIGNNTPAVNINSKATATLSTCIVNSQSNSSLYADSGANVTVNNGDYRNGNVANSANIVANGQGTYIRKDGNVAGGTSTTNGGIVTTN